MTILFLLAVTGGLLHLLRLAIRAMLQERSPDVAPEAVDRRDGATTADHAASPTTNVTVLSATGDDEDGTDRVAG